MIFGMDHLQIAFLLLIAIAVGGAVLAIALPWLETSTAETRVKSIADGRGGSRAALRQGAGGKSSDEQKEGRRKRVQESLKQIEERERQVKKKRLSVRLLIARAGLSISVLKFWLVSAGLGLGMFLVLLILGMPLLICLLAGVIGLVGLPRWFLSMLARRRQQAFIDGLADAIDVIVRGLKAGLPISDAMRVIATEAGPPIGPEFVEVVEGQRVGITIDQGLERMFERIPLPEVSFLGIVISIQSKTGGNLSEALSNLSKVLRDRKKMKGKVRSMSQEAKSSAFIIGLLPFLIIAALMYLNTNYVMILFTTPIGHMILAGCGIWMLTGIIVMRQMINFDI